MARSDGLERSSNIRIVGAAILLLGHNTLARGEDLGCCQGKVDHTRDLTPLPRLIGNPPPT